MKYLVRRGKHNPQLRRFFSALIQGVAGKNWKGEINVLFQWVRNNIRYQLDVDGVETIQTPEQTLALRYGDCDDMVTLLATALAVCGHPSRFVAAGFDGDGNYSHVFLETLCDDEWIALDPTEPNGLGWRPPRTTNEMIIYT